MEEVNLRREVALAREAARRALKQRTMTEIKSLARTQTKLAVDTLVKIMRTDDAPALARVAAANSILDRGWGKPLQPVASEDGKPFEVIHRIERVIVHPGKADQVPDVQLESPWPRDPLSVLGSPRAKDNANVPRLTPAPGKTDDRK